LDHSHLHEPGARLSIKSDIMFQSSPAYKEHKSCQLLDVTLQAKPQAWRVG
jgi:hypothetical protein